jgi:hypothetical protein
MGPLAGPMEFRVIFAQGRLPEFESKTTIMKRMYNQETSLFLDLHKRSKATTTLTNRQRQPADDYFDKSGVGFTPSTTCWNRLQLVSVINKPSRLHRRPLRLHQQSFTNQAKSLVSFCAMCIFFTKPCHACSCLHDPPCSTGGRVTPYKCAPRAFSFFA